MQDAKTKHNARRFARIADKALSLLLLIGCESL